MKKYLLLLSVLYNLIAVNALFAQSVPVFPPTGYSGTTVNFVRIWQANAPGQTASSLQTAPLQTAWQTTKYYDGWGRPMQAILKQGSPLGNDMVTAHLYNSAGLEQYAYLPFVSTSVQSGDVTNNGLFKADGFVQEQAFYNAQLQGQSNELSSQQPLTIGSVTLPTYNWSYQITNYEPSPLNRVLNTYAAGVNWAGTQGGSTPHNTTTEFLVNPASDNVQMWSIAAVQGSIPTSSGAYTASQLYKTITQDEQQHQVITYNDSYGQTILKKVQNTAAADNGTGSVHSGWLCTYYVYDDNGNLRFIITPDVVSQIDGTWTISQTLADELCYRFEYDALNRRIIEKTPGTPTSSSGERWTVYDVRNRPVMVQDGNMRASSQWLCTLYDGLNRSIMTGTINSSNTLSQMQSSVTTATGSNTSGTLSGAAPPTLPGNLTMSLPSESGTSQAAQSITLAPGFSTLAGGTFTAEIVPQTTAPVTSTVVVNNNPLPTSTTLSPLTATFYDNYDWMSTSGAPLSALLNASNTSNSNYFITSYNTSPTYAVPIAQSNQIQGLTTGTMALELGGSATNFYSLAIYDDHGRAIQTQSMNISGGLDSWTYQYSFSGLPLRNLLTQTDPNGSQSYLVSTASNYDAMARLVNQVKSVTSTVAGTTISTPAKTIIANQYTELSQLKQATFGNQLETEQYTYNVRGWQLGMNAAFAETPGTGSNYFGYALGYDYGPISAGSANIGSFTTPNFNGNLAGAVWKTKGDNQLRKYDYTYDAVSWLTGANFNQYDGSAFDKTAGIDFSVSNMSYDANGNLGSMNQNGWILGGSQQIDQLQYNYLNSNKSNRLQYVADNSAYNSSNPSSTLGDFHYTGSKSPATTDYGFDNNGNVTSDANRSISTIAYNYLNLPKTITFTNSKGTISYIYDAEGHKLQKTTVENNASVTYNGTVYTTSITTTTTYIDGFVYKSLAYSNSSLSSLQYKDKLQFIGHEKGRVRALYYNTATPTTPTGYAFDYFLQDQQSNVRMVLTDEQWQDVYPAATLEPNTISTEANYYQITNNASTVTPVTELSWWPNDAPADNYPDSNASVSNPGDPTPGATSTQVYRLNGETGSTYGLGITLKVMAGDAVSILGKSIWHSTGATPQPYPLANVLESFLTSFAGTTPVTTMTGDAVTGPTLYGTSTTTGPLSTLLSNAPSQSDPTVAPKAGINWILFNDQFVPVSMGTDLVNNTTDVLKSHSDLNIPMTSNGYLYVYASNESNIDVFFDNLQVVQTRSPILEETHYYPEGLVMAGISDRSWNKLPNYYSYQSNEMQNQEFSNGTGLEEHDFNARFYDQQLGRWHNQDPDHQYANPYLAMGNNWPNGTDRDGKLFGYDDLIVAGIGFLTGYLSYGLTQHNWGGKALLTGLTDAAVDEGAYLTLGGGLAATSTLVPGGTTAAATADAADAAGQLGSVATATSFAGGLAATNAFSLASTGKQVSQANPWAAYGLLSGYNFLNAVSAGFGSSNTGNKIDAFFTSEPLGNFQTGGTTLQIGSSGLLSNLNGSLSAGIGGLINNVGNQILSAYNPKTNDFNFKGQTVGNMLLAGVLEGGVGSYLGHAITTSAVTSWYGGDFTHLDYINNGALIGGSFTNFLTEQSPAAASALIGEGDKLLWGLILK
jgi:RHS repeat-associated protein